MSGDYYFFVPLWAAVMCVLYCFLDNTDGKQAFRTGNSTPLGELFDHGCDSLIIALFTIPLASVLQVGPWGAWTFIVFGMVPFYLAHWQEYFCHYLECGFLNGPTEAQFLNVLTLLIATFSGASFWAISFKIADYNFIVGDVLLLISVVGTVLTSIQTLFNGSRLALNNNVSLPTAYSQLIPLATFITVQTIWVFTAKEMFLANGHIFLLMINFYFAYLVVNCIIQRMCKLEFITFFWSSVPMILGTVNSVFNYNGLHIVTNEICLYFCFIYYGLLFLHFAKTNMDVMTGILKINAFSIPYPNKATKGYTAPKSDEEDLPLIK